MAQRVPDSAAHFPDANGGFKARCLGSRLSSGPQHYKWRVSLAGPYGHIGDFTFAPDLEENWLVGGLGSFGGGDRLVG